MNATTTLFDKLGGKAAVDAVVDDFYDRILADPSVAHFFTGTDMARQRSHQAAFVALALGSPNEYHGRSMRAAHGGRAIGNEHFAAVAGHLQAALQGVGVGPDDVATILGVVGGLKGDVVDV